MNITEFCDRKLQEILELRSAIVLNDGLQDIEAENNKLRADSIMADSALQELVAQNAQLKALNAELLKMLWRMHKAAYNMGDPHPSEEEVCSLLAKAEKN